jgi:hypothetical protein
MIHARGAHANGDEERARRPRLRRGRSKAVTACARGTVAVGAVLLLLVAVYEHRPASVRVHEAHDKFDVGKWLCHRNCIAQVGDHLTQCGPARWMHPVVSSCRNHQHLIADYLYVHGIFRAKCAWASGARGIANFMQVDGLCRMVSTELRVATVAPMLWQWHTAQAPRHGGILLPTRSFRRRVLHRAQHWLCLPPAVCRVVGLCRPTHRSS